MRRIKSNLAHRLSQSCGTVKGNVAEGDRGERFSWAGEEDSSDCRICGVLSKLYNIYFLWVYCDFLVVEQSAIFLFLIHYFEDVFKNEKNSIHRYGYRHYHPYEGRWN